METISKQRNPERKLRRMQKLRWLSSGSIAAAAALMAIAPQKVEAQSLLSAPDFNPRDVRISAPVERLPVQDIRISAPINKLPANDVRISAPATIAQSGFSPRDVRISSPVESLPVHDVRISAPVNNLPVNDVRISNPVSRLPQQDIRISSPVSLPDAYQPQTSLPDFNVSDVRISSPADIGINNIKISTGVTLPGANQPQAFTPIAAGVQAFVSIASGSVSNPASTVDGVRTIDVVGSGLRDTIQLGSNELILNWVPVDTDIGGGNIDFLPANNILRFVRDAGDYTVLNRILPTDATRAVQFDGFVQSFVNTNVVGGNLWFYSPGGIVVGASGRFDVGSLVLTTTDIDTTGGLFGPSGEMRFTGNVGGGTIRIDAPGNGGGDTGPSIDAPNNNSYVAIVAPRIEQAGSISVNGSTAMVAAEQAVLNINSRNLFDIQIPVGAGTSDANGIVHTGTTTGPTPLNFSDSQQIYMMAVPKNQAMTMLLGGNIGYTAASAAFDQEGSIILSAGGNVSVPFSFSRSSEIDKTFDPTMNANIDMGGANFTNSVEAWANNNIDFLATATSDISGSLNANTGIFNFEAGETIDIGANGGGNLDFTGNLSFTTGNRINFGVGPGSQFELTGDLELNALSGVRGGTVDIDLIGSGSRVDGSGELRVDGLFNIDVGIDGVDARRATVDDGTDTFGGTINLDILSGGLLNITGNTARGIRAYTFDASAAPNMGSMTGANATGGTININVDGVGSTLTATGQSSLGLNLNAQGVAGSNFRANATGGSGTGGNVNFTVNGGSINAEFLSMDASAPGTSNGNTNTNQSQNDAFSGNVTASFTNADLNIGQLETITGARAKTSFDAMGNSVSGNAAGGDLAVTFDNTIFNGASLGLNGDAFGTNNVVTSTGRRNTSTEPLSRCFVVEGLSRPLVQLSCYGI